MDRGNVVVTGASTGIGQASALRLAELGFHVYAGVRKPADGEALKRSGKGALTPVRLDVTDEDSIRESLGALNGKPLAGLVNNAGIVVSGPLELVPVNLWRKQFEVNVIGQVAVTQAFLPALRAGRGRIVNMSSIGGRLALPLAGPYAGSKFALEGISDSLRREVKKWGIAVSLIEPGAILTPIWDKSIEDVNAMIGRVPPDKYELYRPLIEAMRRLVADTVKTASPAQLVVEAVEHALTASRPKTRYLVGRDAKTRILLTRLPDSLVDTLILRTIDSIRPASQ